MARFALLSWRISPVLLVKFFLLSFGVFLFSVSGARANPSTQEIVAVVNGQVISSYDVAQRMLLMQMTTRQEPSDSLREATINELIAEMVIAEEAEKQGVVAPPAQIQATLNSIAESAGHTSESFAEFLMQTAGLHIETLISRIRIQLVWHALSQKSLIESGRLQEQDINRAIEELGEKGLSRYHEYYLRSVVLLTGKQPSDSVLQQRWAEAQRLAEKIQGCENLTQLASELRDVVVHKEIRRKSEELPEKVQEILKKISEGRATTPALEEEGIGFFVICKKVEVVDDSIVRMHVQNRIANDEYAVFIRSYRQSLLKNATIERY